MSVATRFCRALRNRGALVTPSETLDAVRSLEVVDLGDREEVYLALRAILASRLEDLATFEELFDAFWAEQPSTSIPAPVPLPRISGRERAPRTPSLERWLRQDAEDDGVVSVQRASDRETVGTRDLTTLGADDLADMERVAARLARRLAARPSRRWRVSRRGQRVYLRSTIRQSLRTGGEIAELVRRERRLRKTSVVALCDVSGSMDLYSRFLLQFLYALQNGFARVETFVFSTTLSRVTSSLNGETYRDALGRVSREVQGWSGGTRIGASLAAFNAGWLRLVNRRTVVVILSDGWDTGEPAELGRALRVIARRAGRVVWLNPLLGSPSYEPVAGGMRAALPYVDVFAPAHNVASLHDLVRHLRI
ncbi:MAG: vWA domain-containing protein [Gemmatimonadaceae bacterium]